MNYQDLLEVILGLKRRKECLIVVIPILKRFCAHRASCDNNTNLVRKLLYSMNAERPPLTEAELRAHEDYENRPRRRGRKSMGRAERQEVSARMKKYWAGRRKNNRKLSPEEIRLRTGDIDPANIN